MSEQAKQTNAANEADIAAYRQFIENQYGQGASNYSDAVQNFLNSEVYQNNGFSYTDENGNPVTVESFYDPAANQRVAAAMDAINNAAASGGNRFSSDYINRAAGRQAAMASEEWEKAYQRLMQDRQQQMSEWSANSQNAWNNYNAQQGRLQNAVDIYGADRSALSQGISDATMAGLNNRTANLQTQANLLGAKLNNAGTIPCYAGIEHRRKFPRLQLRREVRRMPCLFLSTGQGCRFLQSRALTMARRLRNPPHSSGRLPLVLTA